MRDKVSFIFDTETNGLGNCSLLSISFIISQDYKILAEGSRYYFPEENYNDSAIKINGLTKSVIEDKRGQCTYPLYFKDDSQWLIELLNRFKINNIVGHNTDFDIKFLPDKIKAQIRNNTYSTFCTMKNNINFVGIEKENSYKYPSLRETCNAYSISFDTKKAHCSSYDTFKAYEIFVATMELREKETMYGN